MRKDLLGIFVFSLVSTSAFTSFDASAKVIINEAMQSNVNSLFYENEYPDSWIELYNDDDADTDLSGYIVGVKENPSKGYALPAGTTIKAGGYLLIYCDKEEKGLHTSFRLESGKGSMYIFTPDGILHDKITHAKMPAPDVSLGRDSEGNVVYYLKATPGEPNTSATADALLPAPEFSVAGGLKTSTESLTVSIPADAPADAILCVTTDGSEPTADNAVEAPYTLEITDNISVRAKLLSPTALPRLSTTHSYIFGRDDSALDIISISASPEDLYSQETGILNTEEGSVNYLEDWRRPINIEYFHNGQTDVNQIGETRVQGGYSRIINAQKSLAVYANKRFGEKRFDSSNFWPDKPNVTESKSFILRNAGNDFDGAHMRDAYLQTMIGTHTDNLDYQAYRPIILYINGVYKGVYNLRERSNEDFVEANYDGLEDIDMSENWNEQKVGSEEAVNDFIEFYNREGLTLGELAEVFDIDSFLQKLACDVYATNDDFIRNNAVIWRNTLEGADNRWRVLVKDLDLGIGRWDSSASINMFDVIDNYMTDESFASDEEREFVRKLARLYQFFLDDAEARELLIDRVCFFMGDFFSPAPAAESFNNMLSEFAAEMPATYAVYLSGEKLDETMEAWRYHTTELIPAWLQKRPAILAQQMTERFSLGTPYRLTISPQGHATVNLFGRIMTQDKFDGYYFSGRTLKLHAVPYMCWKADIITEAGTKKRVCYDEGADVEFNAPADAATVAFTLIASSGINDINADHTTGNPSYYTLSGIQLTTKPTTPGIYIMRCGASAEKVVIK